MPAIVSEEKAEGENDDRQELEVTDESMMTEMRHAGPPRFVFFCKDLPTLRAMTEGQALMEPRVDSLEGQVVDILLEIVRQKLLATLGKTSAISFTVSSVFTHNAKF